MYECVLLRIMLCVRVLCVGASEVGLSVRLNTCGWRVSIAYVCGGICLMLRYQLSGGFYYAGGGEACVGKQICM